MAILEEHRNEIRGGFKKGIEASAVDMVLQMVQGSQYQYPLKSSVREIVSNALDSIRERDVAKQILNAEIKVTDVYEEREGDLYNDSKFDPTYYDLKWLSSDPNVYIEYIEGKETNKDSIVISDNGVGLGGYRLDKYFSIGYSTKRLMKLPLGKFGIGNKAPLSLNSYYTLESRYNGMKFRFNIYNDKVESIIPRFNLNNETENKEYTLPNGYSLYYEETEELNGVRIIMEAKKCHKEQLKEAVETQLLYFDNIIYSIEHANGFTEVIPFKAGIMYEDDYIIISNSTYYSKPHILLNKVNYGYIDFQELELENKVGNVGVKVLPEDVEVHPSRERLLWNDKTKDMILTRFKQVVSSATNLIQQELTETDFIKWVKLCNGISTRYSGDKTNGNVIERLSLLVDMSSIKPYYNSTDIYFSPNLFYFFNIEHVKVVEVRKANRIGKKVERSASLYNLQYHGKDYTIVLSVDRANVRKDKYLATLYPDGFIKVKPPIWMLEEYKDLKHSELLEKLAHGGNTDNVQKKLNESKSEKIWDLLCKSSGVIFYDKVDVPDSFKASYDEEDIEEVAEDQSTEEEIKAARLSAQERRKLEGKVMLQTPRWGTMLSSSYEFLNFAKLEVPVKEIGDWSEEEIYYGNDADRDTLLFVTFLTRDTRNEEPLFCRGQAAVTSDQRLGTDKPYNPCTLNSSIRSDDAYRCTHFFENPKIKIIKVAQATNKYYQDFRHIKKFFYQVNKGVLTMSNMLIEWNTARQIKEEINKISFLFNFHFCPDKQAEYLELLTYAQVHYRETTGFSDRGIADELTTKLVSHLDKVQQFQVFVHNGASTEDIAKLAVEMWKTDKVVDSCAIDISIWTRFKTLLEWAEPIRVLLNEMPLLTGSTYRIIPLKGERVRDPLPEEVESSIFSYLKHKGVI